MAERYATLRQDTVALMAEITMNIFTALDLHSAGLRTNTETLAEIKALAEELHTVMTDEAQKRKDGAKFVILKE